MHAQVAADTRPMSGPPYARALVQEAKQVQLTELARRRADDKKAA